MKKALLKLSILFVVLSMVMLLGTLAHGGVAALLAASAEAGLALLTGRLYGSLEREQRRAERRARRDAQAHKAAQLYRAGVRIAAPCGTAAPAAGESRKAAAVQLRVA